MSASVLVIMQGRLNSSRLPGKGLFTFFGQTIWERMCDIGSAIGPSVEVVFATGDRPENYIAKEFIEAKGVRFYAGSEDNVLERFASVSQQSSANYIVRVTCDNYLIQPAVISGLISLVSNEDADYGYVEPLSHFAGEVIRRELLVEEFISGKYSEMAREHVTFDIRSNRKYKLVTLPSDYLGIDHHQSITLDSLEDLIRLRKIERRYPGCSRVSCIESVKSIQAEASSIN